MKQSQANKEILFNENILKLDIVNSALMNDVVNGDNTPPDNAQFGLYYVGLEASGDWENYSGFLAYYFNGWKFIKPWEGMILWHKPSAKIFVYYNNIWNKSN